MSRVSWFLWVMVISAFKRIFGWLKEYNYIHIKDIINFTVVNIITKDISLEITKESSTLSHIKGCFIIWTILK